MKNLITLTLSFLFLVTFAACEDPARFCVDADGDGYVVVEDDRCEPAGPEDCDDADPDIHPGAPEDCYDGVDNDCDGLVDGQDPGCESGDDDTSDDDTGDDDTGDDDTGDDDVSDDDTGDDDTTPPDSDGDGFDETVDCDDANPAIYPGAAEVCNGLDDNCDGAPEPDEVDADGDGYMVCGLDCDDSDPQTYYGAPELCDGLDNDCNGSVPADEQDLDLDGYFECDGDCDDYDSTVNPGASEIACDGVDNDCDAATLDDEDADGDGSGACDDCDDSDASVYPGAAEVDEDGIDQDCDGYDTSHYWWVAVDITTGSNYWFDPEGDGGGYWEAGQTYDEEVGAWVMLCVYGYDGDLTVTAAHPDQPEPDEFIDGDGQDPDPCWHDGVHDKVVRIESWNRVFYDPV